MHWEHKKNINLGGPRPGLTDWQEECHNSIVNGFSVTPSHHNLGQDFKMDSHLHLTDFYHSRDDPPQ